MEIKLTKEECQNVVVALASLAKSPNATIVEMKLLLTLSEKFIWQESIPESTEKDNKEMV
uniref:Uncharacterized protein n=1 Tax=viral metagenome TaxID=1070528 RepID=A0A6M3K7V8_9ZZZZ